mgnify:CR=1 FL=1
MNDRENDTKKETDGRQVQQELESQLRAFGDTMSDAFAHGFEGRGEDIGDRAYGVGRAAVDAANYGINEAAKAFRSRRNAHSGAPEQKEQGLNEKYRAPQAAGMPGWFRQMFGKAEMTPADEIRASAKKRYSAGCALLAVGITFTVIFGITAVSCLGAAGLFTPNTAVLQAILQDSFMAENAAAMGSFALGAVRITGWCFAAVTAVFVWMITAGASRLKASKTLLRFIQPHPEKIGPAIRFGINLAARGIHPINLVGLKYACPLVPEACQHFGRIFRKLFQDFADFLGHPACHNDDLWLIAALVDLDFDLHPIPFLPWPYNKGSEKKRPLFCDRRSKSADRRRRKAGSGADAKAARDNGGYKIRKNRRSA